MREHVVLTGEGLDAYLAARPYLTIDSVPYADDIVDKYVVEGWGLLTKQIEDPATDPAQLGKLRSDRAKLYMKAVHNSDVYTAGPVREREEEPVLGPMLGPELPPGELTSEGRVARAKKWLKGHFDNISELWKEDKLGTATAIALGFVGGGGSIITSHLLAESAINFMGDQGLANPVIDLLVGTSINIGGNYLLNKKLFLDTIMRGKVAPFMAKLNHLDGNEDAADIAALGEEIIGKIKQDGERIMSTVLIADLSTKVVAGTLLPIANMVGRIGDVLKSLTHVSTGSSVGEILADNALNHLHGAENQVGDAHLGGDEGGLAPVLEPPVIAETTPDAASGVDAGEVDVQSADIPSTGLEHLVTGNSEMLTQILVDHGFEPYSGDYITLLSENQDVFAEMLQKTYPDGNVPVLVDLATDKWAYVPVEQAVQNLKEVIAAGYPDPTKMSAEAYRAALTKMFNSVRYLLPGTKIDVSGN